MVYIFLEERKKMPQILQGLGWKQTPPPHRSIEMVVAEQERAFVAREEEIRTAIVEQNPQREFGHIPTDLEEK